MKNPILSLAFFFFLTPSYASSENLYELGQKAYQSLDYINAIKYLYAYKTVNTDIFSKDPNKVKLIDAAISDSESKIKSIIAKSSATEACAPFSRQITQIPQKVGIRGAAHTKPPAD
jgi:hypothetical protein